MLLSSSLGPPQQEHVQLRRSNKASGFKPATMVAAMMGTIVGLCLIVMVYLGAQALQGPANLTNATPTKKLRDTGDVLPRTTTTEKMPQRSPVSKISTEDDMEGLFHSYHKNPALGSEAIFAATPYCADKAATEPTLACRLWLPVDTPDTKRDVKSSPHLLPSAAALQTWKGKKDIVQVRDNQDRSVMILYDTVHGFGGGSRASLMLLADGHGTTGHVVAEQVTSDLPLRILQALEALPQNHQSADSSKAVEQVLKKAFLETDEIILRDVDIDGGSTVVVALYWDNNLYLVSAGDSTGALAEWDGNQAIVLHEAVKHKPGDPEESARIKAKGGQVVFPPGDLSSRVIIPSKRGEMFDSALAMSRCMGDADGKQAGFLIAEPAVNVIPLQQHVGKQLMVLISSDGVTDFHPVEQVMKRLGAAMFRSAPEESLQDAVEGCLEHSSIQWKMMAGQYRDDMSLMVARLNL